MHFNRILLAWMVASFLLLSEETCSQVAAPPATASVVEYYYAAADEYFISANPAEISALDNNRFPGWVRTGLGFGAYATATVGASPVCRFFIPPASHFYSASPAECALTQQRFPTLGYESANVFYIALPDAATGACPAGTIPVYRLFDNRADPNHRYSTSTAVVDQVRARGWIPEGYGPGPYYPIMCSPPLTNTLFQDTFSVTGNHLDFGRWTTEIGPSSFLGRTQLADWLTPGGVGKFVVGTSGAQLSLSTFNPTGFSLYGTHGKSLASFQPVANTTLSYTARLQLTALQPGLVYGLYFYGCPGPCATQHDEIDIELVTNLLQSGASRLQVQVNTYANEPLGAGNGALINLPAGFDPLAAHDWTIRWSLARVDYLVDGVLLASTDTHVPQGPMQINVIAWGPATDWSTAYSALLQPVRSADQNQTFTAILRSATLTSSSPAVQPVDDLTCASGTVRPTGLNAGYASFHRYDPDWKPADTGDHRIYDGRVGGVGNTLEYLGCAGANYVWLSWEYGGFKEFAVRAPWSGQTDQGLRIGDDLSRFHALYPTAHPPVEPFPGYYAYTWPRDFDVWDVGPLRVVLRGGLVFIIEVDWGFANEDPDTKESTRTVVGPCCDSLQWYQLGE